MLRAKDYKQKKNYVMVLNNEHKHSSLSTHAHAHISIHTRSSNGLVLALEQHICCPSLINTPLPELLTAILLSKAYYRAYLLCSISSLVDTASRPTFSSILVSSSKNAFSIYSCDASSPE